VRIIYIYPHACNPSICSSSPGRDMHLNNGAWGANSLFEQLPFYEFANMCMASLFAPFFSPKLRHLLVAFLKGRQLFRTTRPHYTWMRCSTLNFPTILLMELSQHLGIVCELYFPKGFSFSQEKMN
jgi:hypothetical protein